MNEAADPAPAADRLRAFGRWLQQERELRDLGREQIAQATRLAPSVIEALESGEEERMPPRGYVAGYLRSVAAAAGLDPDEVVLRWQEAVGEAPPAPAAAAPRIPPRRALALAGAALLVLLALIAGALMR